MVHLYFGSGKGKTTAALGLVLRGLAAGYRVALFKFFKPRGSSGEDRLLKKFKNLNLFCSSSPHPFFIRGYKKKKEKALRDQALLFQPLVYKGFKEFEGHLLGQTALVEPQVRTDDDDRPAGIIDPLSQKVLAEPALLAFEHVR